METVVAPERTSKGRGQRPGHAEHSLRLAYTYLRDLIVRGGLAPGSRLVESELAGRLGVSRTPIRGALQWLEREGYISVESREGGKARMSVAPLTRNDAHELYWIIGHVEGLAARLAAHLEAHSRATLVRNLRELNDRLRELAGLKGADPNRIFDLDMTFHRSIVEAAAGPRLLAFHGAIKPQTERYWRLYASGILDQLELSVAEHLRIIRAIEQGDADAADRAIRANWQNGAKRLAAVIDSLGERGCW